MRDILCVSISPEADPTVRRPVADAVACLGDGSTAADRFDQWTDGWAAFAGIDSSDQVPGNGEFVAILSRLFCTRERDLTAADLPSMLEDPTTLTRVLPPFGAVHRGSSGPVTIVNDWLGYRQLYWWRGRGVAAVSTSARALSALAGAGFDEAGLGAQAKIGWQIGDGTIFAGVRALPPASRVSMARGDLVIREYAPRLDLRGAYVPLDDAVEEMAAILVAWQSQYLERHPDSVLQLTGGHDSRILLGATPDKLRRGLRVLTLGEDRHPDVVIAGQLAERYGLVHQVRRLTDELPTPALAHETSVAAARALECLASPMALAPLLLMEATLEQGHRMSGLGGEVARGFYYAGQSAAGVTSAALVERLAQWRVFANEAVEEAAVTPDFLAAAAQTTLARMAGLFPSGDWLRATDDFYLYQRMRRWSGAHGSVAAVRRFTVNPMLDHRFVELALAVAPHQKRDSLLLGRLMTRLDPALAQIPLDSGLVPARLGSRDMATRIAIGAVTARKAAGKLRQRLFRGRRPQLGAAEVAWLVLAHWRAEPSACQALYAAPGLDHKWLDDLLDGTHTAAPTTIAYLVNLVAATPS